MQVEIRSGGHDGQAECDDVKVEKPRGKKKNLELPARVSFSPNQQHAHLAAIIESSEDAIISKSLDGTILTWNKAAERILGYAAKDIIGCSISVLIPPDRQGEEMRILRRLQETGGRLEHFSTVRLNRDGSRLDVIISVSPIRDESGRIIGASKILRGMNDQRASEQAIRDSEARLRAVFASASDVIITLTELGAIESINQAGLLAFGYRQEELIGQNVARLMAEPNSTEEGGDSANLRDSWRRKLIGTGSEATGRRKDGTTFPMDLAVSEVQLDHCRLFTVILRDVTRRKQTEQALVEAKENAEATSKARERFLSILSHELRTPLTPALAELSFIEQETDLPLELCDRLKMVRRNIETEARLVDDLLDMTRITQGKIHLHCESVDLHDAVHAALAMFGAAIDRKRIEINVALGARQHHVFADPGRLQQILLNLLSNAVKFTPANGRISIRSSNDETGQIEMEIIDSGVGIDPEMLPRVFNPFEQSDRTRRLGGLGLGLSIARSLTELHMGKLTASSDGRDLGSAFRLVLATSPSAVNLPPLPKAAESPGIEQRILLVEDHDDTRAVLARLLQSLGCHVTVARTVREALETGEAGSFDLLISDIGLPDGSGLEVMRQLKSKISRGVALSGFGQQEDLRRSREAGFELHLTKPVNFNMLKGLLQKRH
jgi:two-component system CheB/CheR fusion protein